MRTDVANVYGPSVDEGARYFSRLVADAVESAVRLDAACVVVNLLWLPGRDELLRACIENVAALKARCEPAGMPLMVEPLAMRPGAEGYGVDGDPDRICALVRQAVELGAEVIKADPTDDLGDYGRVVEVAGAVPVLVRGGGRASDEEVMRRTELSRPSFYVYFRDRHHLLGRDRLQLFDEKVDQTRRMSGHREGTDLLRLVVHRIALVDMRGDRLRLHALQFVFHDALRDELVHLGAQRVARRGEQVAPPATPRQDPAGC